MQQARHDLLARAGSAHDQDAAVGRCNLLDVLAQLADRVALADQVKVVPQAFLQGFVFSPKTLRLQGAFDRQQDAVSFEGLLDKVVGTLANGGNGGFDVSVARNDEHRKIGIVLLDFVQHLQTVEAASLQPDVQDHERGPSGPDLAQGAVAVASGTRIIPLVREDTGNKFPDVGLVVDDQHIQCLKIAWLAHSHSPASFMAPSRRGNDSRTSAPLSRVAPVSSVLGASSRDSDPLWSSMIFFTIASPSPVPFTRLVT